MVVGGDGMWWGFNTPLFRVNNSYQTPTNPSTTNLSEYSQIRLVLGASRPIQYQKYGHLEEED
jgi:hypothetical protein